MVRHRRYRCDERPAPAHQATQARFGAMRKASRTANDGGAVVDADGIESSHREGRQRLPKCKPVGARPRPRMDNKWTTSASVALNARSSYCRVNALSVGYAVLLQSRIRYQPSGAEILRYGSRITYARQQL